MSSSLKNLLNFNEVTNNTENADKSQQIFDYNNSNNNKVDDFLQYVFILNLYNINFNFLIDL